MLGEFVLVGAAIAAIMLFLGWFGNEKRIHLIVAGAIVLIITGLFIAADTSGVEIQTYGGCMNQSVSDHQYANVTTATSWEWQLDNITTNNTYGPCYHHTLGFNWSQALAIMLMLVGIGLMLGVFYYVKGSPFKE